MQNSDSEKRRCTYRAPSGTGCPNDAGNTGLCFWHNPDAPKNGRDIKQRLLEYAASGRPMTGFRLAFAELEGIDLVRRSGDAGFDLSHADLFHANLKNARLINVNLQDTSLSRANLQGASLQFANLKDANLLGANMRRAKIDHVLWGERIRQENQAKEAEQASEPEKTEELYKQAEEIYRSLRRFTRDQGLYDLSGEWRYKELVMRRRQLPKLSFRRFLSKIFDLLCGYGEKPLRVIIFSILAIVACALVYFALGISHSGTVVAFDVQAANSGNLIGFAKAVYFSVVTFTTLGYGDFVPIGLARLVSALEAFTGAFTIALFVVVFVRKMTRL